LTPLDAAHVAYAVESHADFVSVDDRLLKKSSRLNLTVWTGSPLLYCEREKLK
jgi:hypothetical protein